MKQVRIDRNWNRNDSYGIWLFEYSNHDTKCALGKATEITMEPWDSMHLPEPTFSLPSGWLKALGHALVESGQLPLEFFSNANELAAVRAHLRDLKKIAFHTVGVPSEPVAQD